MSNRFVERVRTAREWVRRERVEGICNAIVVVCALLLGGMFAVLSVLKLWTMVR